MRECFYTPEASENLAELGATRKDLDLIHQQFKRLAAQPTLGFSIPLQLLEFPAGLFQYEVGPYKLNYIFTDEEIWLISVLA